MRPTGRGLRSLVEAGRADEPTAADRVRVRAQLAVKLGLPFASVAAEPLLRTSSTAGGAPSTTATATATPPAGAASASAPMVVSLGKAIFAVALVGTGTFAAGYFTGSSGALTSTTPIATPASTVLAPPATRTQVESSAVVRAEPPPAVATAAPSVASTTAASTARGARDTSESESAASRAPAASVRTVPSSSAQPLSTLTAELDLLRAAQAALRSNDAERSLGLLDELHGRYPDGVLREEQAAARVLALCAAERPAEARGAARSFLATWPKSLHADRVRAACSAEPVAGGDER